MRLKAESSQLFLEYLFLSTVTEFNECGVKNIVKSHNFFTG